MLQLSPGPLHKKDATVQYLNPSCEHHSPSAHAHAPKGACSWCAEEFKTAFCKLGQTDVCGDVKVPGQNRGQSSCDTQRRGQEEVGWWGMRPGRD